MDSKIFRREADSLKDSWPILYSMYDASDPEHTFGCSDYFIEQMEDFLNDAKTEEEIQEIKRTISFLEQYDEIEIY